ncbi:MAG: PIN domain-containing protein [Deltaproteobacteria bacterium]|nr:MAG: PIN domain-containing protein [Deltaproteobacteria bacterium]
MPGRDGVYFDTSALAKWYLNESHSEAVEKYIRRCGPVGISDLTVVEMRSLLARRRREKEIDAGMENRVFATFEEDIRQGFLECHPLSATVAAGAANLISMLPDVPLRTLDSLHLAVAQEWGAGTLATFDAVMAEAAVRMGILLADLG